LAYAGVDMRGVGGQDGRQAVDARELGLVSARGVEVSGYTVRTCPRPGSFTYRTAT
jgi:hypothetical protein